MGFLQKKKKNITEVWAQELQPFLFFTQYTLHMVHFFFNTNLAATPTAKKINPTH